MYPSGGGEKGTLKLNANNAHSGKSGHIHSQGYANITQYVVLDMYI